METVSRTNKYLDYIKYYKKLWLLKDKHNNHVYTTKQSMFNKTLLSSGIEGKVYKANLKNKTRYLYKKIRTRVGFFVIKTINLKTIKEKKIINENMLNAIPDEIYKLFYSKDSYNRPSLIEIISNKLTNQLVFQKICPHYILNYNWDYQNSKIRLYNEYATYGDFYSWSKQKHSDELWYNALFQIMVGLLAIQKYFNMIHTDFHLGNILVHKIKPGGYWIYKINGHKFYLPNLGFVFLISDFGFAWIPGKLYIPWHYKDTLQFIRKKSYDLYDISTFISSIKNLSLPTLFSKTLSTFFKNNEFLVFTKSYYKERLQYYKSKTNSKTSAKTKYYKQIVDNYSKYTSPKHNTLIEKIFNIFSNIYKLKPENYGKCIETYSLDKRFVKNKVTKVFQKMIV
jgi:hypothetical protein